MHEYLIIKIKTGGMTIEKDLNIRYTLSDTIMERGIGEVVEEGTGENYILLVVKARSINKTQQRIKPILLSLGLLEITEFSYQ